VIVALAALLPAVLTHHAAPPSQPNGSLGAAQPVNRLVRVDTGLNRVVAQIPVGKSPSAVTVGAGSVWVANSDDATVSRIDPVTNKVTAVIHVGANPTAIGFDGNDVWIANQLSQSVSEIDPGSNRVIATIPLPGSPHTLAFGKSAVIVGTTGGVAAAINAKSPVVRIDPDAHRAMQLAGPQGVCSEVAANNDAIWTTSNIGSVLKLNPSTDRPVAQSELGLPATGILVDDQGVWIATAGSPGQLELLDPATLRVTATVPVGTTTEPHPATGTCQRPVSMAEANGFLWVTNVDDGTISQVSLDSRSGAATIPVGKSPTGVAVGFGSVWVTVAAD
jgi:YVTN family beta-propeller protein